MADKQPLTPHVSTDGQPVPPEEMFGVAGVYQALLRAGNVELPYFGDYYRYRETPGFAQGLAPSILKLKNLLASIEQYRVKGTKTVDEASASEALDDKPHENFSWFESLLDDCLERVNHTLETANRDQSTATCTGAVAEPKFQPKNSGVKVAKKKLPGWGQFGSKSKDGRTPKYVASQDKAFRKPQDQYDIKVDNSDTPFAPRLENLKGLVSGAFQERDPDEDEVLQSIVGNRAHCGDYPHPLHESLDKLVYMERQLEMSQEIRPRLMEFTKFVFVDTKNLLDAMCKDLSCAEEIAVDLEHNDLRSFLGLTCLIQISTRKADYIVDPFPLWEEVGPALAPIFGNPKIAKVFHGAFNDIIWLQRDFSIYVVNMFDTCEACRVLETEKKSLAFLLQHYCKVETDKKYQMADWRVRPLGKDMMLYARMDTHYLLYIYDLLRQELIQKGRDVPERWRMILRDGVENSALGTTLERSRMVTLQRYAKPSVEKSVRKATNSNQIADFSAVQKRAYAALVKWRFSCAQADDESPRYIISHTSMQKIAARLPDGVSRLRSMLASHEKYASAHAGEILEVVGSATSDKKPQSMLFAPLPKVPTFRASSDQMDMETESIEPKVMAPLKMASKGMFGKLIVGDIDAKTVQDRISGDEASGSSSQEVKPIPPIAATSTSSVGAFFGACSKPGGDKNGAFAAEIHASFSLPFHQPVLEVEPESITTLDDNGKTGVATGSDVRAAMDQILEEGGEKNHNTSGEKGKSCKAVKKVWHDDLGDFLPAPVTQAYQRKPASEGAQAQPLEPKSERCEARTVLDSVCEDAGLSVKKAGLVAAELKELSNRAVSHSSNVQQHVLTTGTSGVVVPFEYSKAREDKKQKRMMDAHGSTGVKPVVKAQDGGFKKPKRRKLHPKSGNRSTKFTMS